MSVCSSICLSEIKTLSASQMPISPYSSQTLCHSATMPPPSQPLRIITISHHAYHAYHVHQPRCHLATMTYHVCAYQSSDLFSLPLSLSACLWTKTYHFRIEKGNINESFYFIAFRMNQVTYPMPCIFLKISSKSELNSYSMANMFQVTLPIFHSS